MLDFVISRLANSVMTHKIGIMEQYIPKGIQGAWSKMILGGLGHYKWPVMLVADMERGSNMFVK